MSERAARALCNRALDRGVRYEPHARTLWSSRPPERSQHWHPSHGVDLREGKARHVHREGERSPQRRIRARTIRIASAGD
ncbi:hypothetical protein CBM2585_A10063 [Cupriavidus taiwanensis]|nr:hypothetical protein CBM2585_A10063 [Cupriavidus taiwanensis]